MSLRKFIVQVVADPVPLTVVEIVVVIPRVRAQQWELTVGHRAPAA